MAWIQAGVAAYGMYNNKKQKDAMQDAQGRAGGNIEAALAEARKSLAPYSDVGKSSLYRLASLMGDDRFGSTEAQRLHELKAPDPVAYGLPQIGKLQMPGGLTDYAGKVGGWDSKEGDQNLHGLNQISVGSNLMNRRRKKKYNAALREYEAKVNKYKSELDTYNSEKQRLEGIVAQQKADGTYQKSGSDYLRESEGYKFRIGQGQKNTLRALSANRGVLGGGALKELDEYAQGFAANEFNNEYQRLAGMAGMGQQAAGVGAGYQISTGSNLANLALQGGNTLANYYGNQNQIGQDAVGNYQYAQQTRQDKNKSSLQGRSIRTDKDGYEYLA